MGRGNTRKRSDTIRGKFPEVKFATGPVLYVAEFDNGIVKVGFTSNARARLSILQTEARRLFGETSISRFHVGRQLSSTNEARSIEGAALAFLRLEARPAGERFLEYFRDLPFDRAVQIVTESV